jgi:hypothetical protein
MDIPVVDPSRAIVLYVRVEDLNNFFRYSLYPDGAPKYLGFDARSTMTTTSLSGFGTETTFIDDSGNEVLPPATDFYPILESLVLGAVLPSFSKLWGRNLNQTEIPLTTREYNLADIPLTAFQDSPAQNAFLGPYNLSGSWSEVPGGDALLSLYNDLSSNGRIVVASDPTMIQFPEFILGDSLRYFVNISQALDIGYHWSQSSFSTICSAEFSVTNFCAALIHNVSVSQGTNLMLSDGTQYDIRNGGYVSNVVYSVTMVATSL